MTVPQKDQYQWVGTAPVRPDGVDKVTGRALYGADLNVPNMVWGKVLRSPHAHAKILSIDTAPARELEGVLSVITSADLDGEGFEEIQAGEASANLADVSANVLAKDKVLYHGHAVAAVAAINAEVAANALKAIKVEYEVLTPVLSLDEAIAENAPLLHDEQFTAGYSEQPTSPSNIAGRHLLEKGDVQAGMEAADVVVERTYTIPMAHQGYIEPQACLAEATRDGHIKIWCCTQGQFDVRNFVSKVLDIDVGDITVTPSEIGGGFGGKTTIYLEPVAAVLSQKCARPVKMVMSREEVFRASGPGAGASVRVRIGASNDGVFTAMDTEMYFEAGAFKGSPSVPAAMAAFAAYDCANQRAEAFDVVVNKPKVAAYRAPGAPQAALGVECVINEIATKLAIDPLELRMRNAADEGTSALYGAVFSRIGFKECLQQAMDHPHYSAALEENQGRGVAAGFWFNVGMQSNAVVHLTESGRLIIDEGSPDIGGSRASMALMAAETLGIDYEHVTVQVKDTASIGVNDVTGGSRTTYTTGWAVIDATRGLIEQLCERAARVWDIPRDQIDWQQAAAISLDGSDQKLSLAELAAMGGKDEGPLSSSASKNVKQVAPSFGVGIVEVGVDPGTGATTVLRYTSIQDAGKAIHPAFVEGQMQGGAVQGIGWALNEEYVFNEQGVMQNPGFLDYRIPVASDLPMIDTVIVEVPDPLHPFGVRGVGETPICPPVPAVCTAVNNAVGTDIADLPLAPWRVLQAIHGIDGEG